MAISEIQLATWAKQGQTAQFTSTYDNIKTVLGHDNSPYSLKNFGIFLQGSYKNDTNIYGDSDLDIIINLKDIFYYLDSRTKCNWVERFGKDLVRCFVSKSLSGTIIEKSLDFSKFRITDG